MKQKGCGKSGWGKTDVIRDFEREEGKGADMAYESKFKRDDIDELFKAVLLLENEEDCYRFFEDICTVNEIHAIAQRLQVAKLLSEDKTYNEIEDITKASTATISRVNKCLVYGSEGYKRILKRLEESEENKADQED